MKQFARAGAAMLSLGLAACSVHGSQPSPLPGTTSTGIRPLDVTGGIGPALTRTLSVLLGDGGPKLGDKQLSHLNLGVLEIDAVSNGATTVLAKYDKPRIVDVLAHQENDGERVARSNVATTTYQQIRLVVDLPTSQAVFNGNKTEQLTFLTNTSTFSTVGAGANTATVSDGPGAVDMIVTQPFSIPSDADPSVRVDFNAFESLAMQQNGTLYARPALFVAPTSDMALIDGTVKNAQGVAVKDATVVAVAQDGSIANTASTANDGTFQLSTLTSGTYNIVIYNGYTTAAGQRMRASNTTSNAQSITGPAVTVTGGQTTHLGTVAD